MTRRFVFQLGLSLLMVPLAVRGTTREVVTGSMKAQWNPGAQNCATAPEDPIEVHTYERQTIILRQNLCADFEGNFLYLLIGSKKALLIETGAVDKPDKMPLAKTVIGLLPGGEHSNLSLLVVHTHEHGDHYAGDSQFESLASTRVVPANLNAVKEFFGLPDWPNGMAQIDLGDRIVDVIPAPGHQTAHVVFYDERTGIVFSGDLLMPGRLTVEKTAEYRESAKRVAGFAQDHPITHVLGGHIEMDASGQLYPHGSTAHPNERPLELAKEDLLSLPSALDAFNGFYARYPNFVITHPIHNLTALASLTLVVGTAMVWGIRRLMRRLRRDRKPRPT